MGDIFSYVLAGLCFLFGSGCCYLAFSEDEPGILWGTIIFWVLAGLIFGLAFNAGSNDHGIRHDLKEQEFTVREINQNADDGIEVQIDRDDKIFTCKVSNDNEDHYWIIEDLGDCRSKTKAKIKAVKPEELDK